MAINDNDYSGPGYGYSPDASVIRDTYGKRFLGRNDVPYVTFEAAQRSYYDTSISMNPGGSWSTAIETVTGESGDMNKNGTQVFAVSEAEIMSALGLAEDEKITNITWEKGTNHFPGGIVITTETPKTETGLAEVKASKK